MAHLHLVNVSLDYPVYHGSSRSLKKSLLAASTQGNLARDALDGRVSVRALSNIDLDLKNGDRLGLIGPNGAGKTTLLKVLGGIFEPSNGYLSAAGRVSALLDTTVGLNPEATGRENIVLRGMFMDIHPKEMRRHADDVAEFTELGNYLDMPVRTYSAGMMVRLAFAISTCVPPEILVMDEWLAAGDARFLAKAQKRMETFVEASSILVLASHSLPLIQAWCTSALLLDQGHILAAGAVDEVVAAYQAKFGG
jgi:ABC-type polysaccharide/polyol phosphate transport system ATPase subunit